jgi:2-hydroxy-3-keto-5-methylthiopentenyl-1-phosphate phosphatase
VTRLTPEPQAVVFLDFDGTITRRDATDAILEAFADRRWLDVEEAWITGRIGSRDCLAAQMDLVTATRDQVDQLLDGIDVDPGFRSLLDGCEAKSLPVHIISAHFRGALRLCRAACERMVCGGVLNSLIHSSHALIFARPANRPR